MIDCIADYNNDNIANARAEVGDPETESTAVNMYETSKAEGHDARLLRFKASADGTVPGTHTVLKSFPHFIPFGLFLKETNEGTTDFDGILQLSLCTPLVQYQYHPQAIYH